MRQDTECGDNRMTRYGQRKLGQIQGCRFFQVCHRFLKGFTLCRRPGFGIERNISTFFSGRKDSGEIHSSFTNWDWLSG